MRKQLALATAASLVASAAAQDKEIQRGAARPPRTVSTVDSGAYYALVIGIDQYPHLPQLKTAVSDAKSVETLLREGYQFRTKTLTDASATRYNILDAMSEYRSLLKENDSLLVYYADHGHFDRDADKAYWLPVDANSSSTANWILADDITTGIKVLPARHVLIVSDSCYSGAISREAGLGISPRDHDVYVQKMLASKSRTLIASGGNEPVTDSGKNGHSIFANAILNALATIDMPAFTAANLFERYIREPVAGGSDQVPQYGVMRNSGHEAGDFVFFRHPPSNVPITETSIAPGQAEGCTQDALTTTPRLLKDEKTVAGQRIRVAGDVMQAKIVHQPQPIYPPLAREARISGHVLLDGIINKDGTVQNLHVVCGHPLLVPAALQGVKQWVYQPTLLNGEPVEVVTRIDINFDLTL
jgi:TonB family protein